MADPIVERLSDAVDVREAPPIVERIDTGQAVETSRPSHELFGRGANIGIAETLGAPVDFVSFLLGLGGLASKEPLGGSDSIRRMFSQLGIAPAPDEEDPKSLPGEAGKLVGAAATMLLPVGAAAKSASEIARGLRATPRTIPSSIVQSLAKNALERPVATIVGETAAAAAAATGGFVAEKKFPDSEAARLVGELIGGVAPSGLLGIAKITPTIIGARAARRIASQFTQSGARRRAGRRMETVARHPQKAQQELGRETLPGLTPAQQTGDEGLLSLERSVIDSSEQLKNKSDEQISAVTKTIQDSLKELGEGVPVEQAGRAIAQRRQYLSSLIEARLRIAAQSTEEKIAGLSPTYGREDANRIAREELEKALTDIRAQERQLWELIPESMKVSTRTTNERFTEILAKTSQAQQVDIPAVAQEIIDPNVKSTTVREMQGLRSKLLEEARKARAAGDFNKARISDEIADAILTDLGAQRDGPKGPAGEALRTALDFSADLNERFTRGTAARILGTERRGGARVPEAMTLETTLGGGGMRAKAEMDALLRATDTPALRGAMEDFILNDFQKNVIRDGEISESAAKAFGRKYGEVLGQMPELRARLESAVDASAFESVMQRRAEGLAKRLNDPKVSRGALFVREPLEDAMKRIAKSGNPEAAMTEIVKQAGKDPEGQAIQGLKTAFGDYLLNLASGTQRTADGHLMVSGVKLREALHSGETSKMAVALFNKEELNRLDVIADTAEKLERAIRASGRQEGIIADSPSILYSVMARITGAQIGRKVATVTGGGTVQTPGILSNVFRTMLDKFVNDPAGRLLADAMQNKKLFETLLESPEAIARPEVRQRLNAWLFSVTGDSLENLGDIDAEEIDLPDGFELIGDENGKRVFRSPDGREFIEE